MLKVEIERQGCVFQNKQERNNVICLAYLEDGYSQIEIASFLGLSKSAISMIIKKNAKSGD